MILLLYLLCGTSRDEILTEDRGRWKTVPRHSRRLVQIDVLSYYVCIVYNVYNIIHILLYTVCE